MTPGRHGSPHAGPPVGMVLLMPAAKSLHTHTHTLYTLCLFITHTVLTIHSLSHLGGRRGWRWVRERERGERERFLIVKIAWKASEECTPCKICTPPKTRLASIVRSPPGAWGSLWRFSRLLVVGRRPVFVSAPLSSCAVDRALPSRLPQGRWVWFPLFPLFPLLSLA